MLCCGTSPCSARRHRALPVEVKQRFPDLPWEQPVRLRNRIVHGYWSIDLEILHTTATDHLPDLAEQLRTVLAVLESESYTS